MHSIISLPLLLALANHVSGEALNHLAGYQAVQASPIPTAGPKLGRRDDLACAQSILTEVMVPDDPSATDLVEYLSTATFAPEDCTVTVPASLSSDLVSYATYVSEFYGGIESRWNEVDSLCGQDTLVLDVSRTGCEETQTAVFTDGSDTESVALPSPTLPTERLEKTSAASAYKSSMGTFGVAVVACAALLAG